MQMLFYFGGIIPKHCSIHSKFNGYYKDAENIAVGKILIAALFCVILSKNT